MLFLIVSTKTIVPQCLTKCRPNNFTEQSTANKFDDQVTHKYITTKKCSKYNTTTSKILNYKILVWECIMKRKFENWYGIS